MPEYNIKLPATDEEVNNLRVGDIVYLSGTIITARDQAHKRILAHDLPERFENIRGAAIYHCGPIVAEQDGAYSIVSAGPTTSSRMVPYQVEVCKKTGIHLVIGKGGMKIDWSTIPGAYLSFPGGCGSIVSKFVDAILGVMWLDLGTPEAVWFLQVEKFGPLVVAQDSENQTLYA